MKNFWYKFFKIILTPLYKIYYNPKIYNKEYLNIDGPIIIAGNHKHVMDQCNVIISTKRVITFMAKKEYFNSLKTRWFFKMVGCIPVDRTKKDESATEKALEILKNKKALGIFPEGTRNKTEEKLLPFKYGTVSMALKTNATIIPYAITGDYKFRSKNLRVKFGQPFKINGMTLNEANEKLYNTILKIINELEKN